MRWLRNLFSRRKTSGAPPSGDSSEDWRPGDLADCIMEEWTNLLTGERGQSGPRLGEVRAVSGVSIVGINGASLQFLSFARYPGNVFAANCFRKITPRADALERGDVERLSDLLKQPEPVE